MKQNNRSFRHGMSEREFFMANPFDERRNPALVLMWRPDVYSYNNPHVAGIFLSSEEFGAYVRALNSQGNARRKR